MMDAQKVWRFLIVFLVLITLVTPLTPPTARAAGLWYVAPYGSDDGPCDNPSAPCKTIHTAIAKAQFGDIIHTTNGTYTGTGSDIVLIDRSLILSGGWTVDFTKQDGYSVINGPSKYSSLKVLAGVSAQVDHFIFQNSPDDWSEISVYIEGNLTFDHVMVVDNEWIGIYMQGLYASLTLNNSSISHNGGFGIEMIDAASLSINNSTISDNGESGGEAGIIIASSGNPIPQIILNNSTVSGNVGPGIDLFNSYGMIELALNNTTIADNIYIGIMNLMTSVVTRNSIIARNSPIDCVGPITSAGHNLIGDTTDCDFTPSDGDLTNIDPQLYGLANNGGPTLTQALESGSPAINAADISSCLALDQRSASRQGTCDIGAYELFGTLLNLSASPDPAVLGEPVTLITQVVEGEEGVPTGTVSFADESGYLGSGILDENGQATLSISTLTLGNHTINAIYSGDSNFSASTSPQLPLKVGYTAVVTITADDPDPSLVGQAVDVSFSVTSNQGTPTGTVFVINDDDDHSCAAELSNGMGNCPIPLTEAGSTNFTATYLGEGVYNTSAAIELHTVNKADTTTSITADSPDPSDPNNPVLVEFNIAANQPGAGTPSGLVTITASDGAETCTGTLNEGSGSCEIILTIPGLRTLTAAYEGDANFSSSVSDGQPHIVTDTFGLCLPYISHACTILYADYFDNPASGWPIFDSSYLEIEYTAGEYHIRLWNRNWGILVRPGFQSSDYIVSVDLRNAWNTTGAYGIVFGLSADWSTFYSLEIDRNQPMHQNRYGIYRYDPQGVVTLAWGDSTAIYPGVNTNQIMVERNGAVIKAYANGQLLTTLIDSTYTGSRYLGLVVFSYEQIPDIYFDNFKVVPVDCTSLNATKTASNGWRSPFEQLFPNFIERAKK
jgi:hypothetical protein